MFKEPIFSPENELKADTKQEWRKCSNSRDKKQSKVNSKRRLALKKGLMKGFKTVSSLLSY